MNTNIPFTSVHQFLMFLPHLLITLLIDLYILKFAESFEDKLQTSSHPPPRNFIRCVLRKRKFFYIIITLRKETLISCFCLIYSSHANFSSCASSIWVAGLFVLFFWIQNSIKDHLLLLLSCLWNALNYLRTCSSGLFFFFFLLWQWQLFCCMFHNLDFFYCMLEIRCVIMHFFGKMMCSCPASHQGAPRSLPHVNIISMLLVLLTLATSQDGVGQMSLL